MVGIDRSYFTPREVAGISHFSFLERLAAFGALAWVFLPLLALIPLKLLTARRIALLRVRVADGLRAG